MQIRREPFLDFIVSLSPVFLCYVSHFRYLLQSLSCWKLRVFWTFDRGIRIMGIWANWVIFFFWNSKKSGNSNQGSLLSFKDILVCGFCCSSPPTQKKSTSLVINNSIINPLWSPPGMHVISQSIKRFKGSFIHSFIDLGPGMLAILLHRYFTNQVICSRVE